MKPLGFYHESNVETGTVFVICAGSAGEIGYSKDQFWAADDVHFAVVPEVVSSCDLSFFENQIRLAAIL